MKHLFAVILCFLFLNSVAQDVIISSPDKLLNLSVRVQDGKPVYSVAYKGKTMLEDSPLGLTTNEGDFTSQMKYVGKEESKVEKSYI